MKITKTNYIGQVKKTGLDNLPVEMQQAHTYILKMTDNGNDWSVFDSNKSVRSITELTFQKLGEFLASINGLDGVKDSPEIKRAKADAKKYPLLETTKLKMIYRMEKDAELEEDGTPQERKIRMSALEREMKKRGASLDGNSDYDPIKEIQFMERFLAFHDKRIYKNTMQIFIQDLQKAIQEKKIRKHSPYSVEVMRMQNAAIQFYQKADFVNFLVLDKTLRQELNNAIVDYENKIVDRPAAIDPIDPVELSGVTTTPESEVMSSVEFAKLKFDCLGFTGKWLNLIGDPTAGFTAMVFGKPKVGKSYLCIEFAGYLARNFGKVVYVAKEERLHATLQKKIKEKNVMHENLFVVGSLPDDLSAYDFIFLDSVNLLGLTPESLRELKDKNPGKSFVYIFQTTKSGNFRGANTFQHDVDIVIEVPERGNAVQFGRFNQGGEMSIFEDTIPQASEELSGAPKKIKYPAWTTPKHLEKGDHDKLKYIYDLYRKGELKEAYNYASYNSDTVIREEIPGDIWKKMGGQLTKSGEEKLKKGKSKAIPKQEPKKKQTLVFNHGVRILKRVIERERDLELTDSDYIEILDIAQDQNENFVNLVNGIHRDVTEFLGVVFKAINQWDQQKGKLKERNKSKFNPAYYHDRKDDENPAFLFSMTSDKVLFEALEGDFDVVYMVRRELANRGLDSKGKWVGFDRAKEIHRVEN